MKGFTIVEQAHVVTLFPVAAGTASVAGTSDTFILKNWAHATMIILGGEGSAATNITVGECTSFAGSDRTAVADFLYAQEATSGGDTLDAALAVGSVVAMGTGNVLVVIELDADKLTDGYPYVQVNYSTPTLGRNIAGVAILSGGRYQEDITVTTIV